MTDDDFSQRIKTIKAVLSCLGVKCEVSKTRCNYDNPYEFILRGAMFREADEMNDTVQSALDVLIVALKLS